MFTKNVLVRRSLFAALGSFLILGVVFAVRSQANEEAVSPTCCAKRAYCCTVKARCCDTGKSVESEVIPVSFVADESGKPTCCDKRAYCCTVKLPCCGKTVLMEIAYVDSSDESGKNADASRLASSNCCAKRAYCCKVKSTCCGKEATSDMEERELTAAELVTFDSERIEGQPTCCAKKAYCCKIKSPCCGKEFDIEALR